MAELLAVMLQLTATIGEAQDGLAAGRGFDVR